jgi:hypothetical protein
MTVGGTIDFGSRDSMHEIIRANKFLNCENIKVRKSERISFCRVLLRPNWFINADIANFAFTDVQWVNVEANCIRRNVFDEFKQLADRGTPRVSVLFKQTCWMLAENSEESSRFEEASIFRRMALEVDWLEKKSRLLEWWTRPVTLGKFVSSFSQSVRMFPLDLAHIAYRWSSYYGESWNRAAMILFTIVLTFALIYWSPLCSFGSGKEKGLEISEAISYSARVMVLQRPEPFPKSSVAYLAVAAEVLMGPTQLALLALALRRKFMR